MFYHAWTMLLIYDDGSMQQRCSSLFVHQAMNNLFQHTWTILSTTLFNPASWTMFKPVNRHKQAVRFYVCTCKVVHAQLHKLYIVPVHELYYHCDQKVWVKLSQQALTGISCHQTHCHWINKRHSIKYSMVPQFLKCMYNTCK